MNNQKEITLITLENYIEILNVNSVDEVDWLWLSTAQTLSEDFIREFQNKVYWEWISRYQTLSKKFILEFLDKFEKSLIWLLITDIGLGKLENHKSIVQNTLQPHQVRCSNCSNGYIKKDEICPKCKGLAN